jgi:hypothetical protein
MRDFGRLFQRRQIGMETLACRDAALLAIYGVSSGITVDTDHDPIASRHPTNALVNRLQLDLTAARL